MYKNLRRSLARVFPARPSFGPARLLAATLVATASLTAHSAPADTAQPGIKIGFVYVSPVGDTGWTYQHDLGRREMEQALAARNIKVQATVVDSVPEGPDAERVMRDLAARGHKLIFATSFGYLEPALKVAHDFPGVVIEHAGGYKTAPNLGTYIGRFYEARYLAGVLAGATSKSGVAGYVAGFPVPEVVQGINAFTLGMRSVNPKAQVKVVWLDAWFDPAREREAALTLVHQGADVLTHHSGSSAVAATAEAEKVRVIPYPSDMRHVAPHAQLAAIVHDWGGFYTRTAQAVADGTWKNTPVWGCMREGFVKLTPPAADVDAKVQSLLRHKQAELLAGKLQAFSGRIIDTQGREHEAGQAMKDADIQAMDWYVDGVIGGRTAGK